MRWDGELRGRSPGALAVRRSRPGATSSPPGATSCERKIAAGQHDLAGELAEGVRARCARRSSARRGKQDRGAARARAGHDRRSEDPGDREARPGARAASCSPRSSGTASATARPRSSEPLTSRSTARAPASAPGTSCSRARGAASKGVEKQLPQARRARLRRALPAADPPDRPDQPQGPQQRARRRASATRAARGRSAREAGGHDAVHPELGTIDDFDALTSSAARAGHRDRARLRDPVLGRPPVAERAPGVVPPPPRRHAQVRREPAQALPGHLQRQLGLARTGAASGRRCSRSCCTGSTAACRSSASTTRTPSRSRSGSG